MTKNLDLFEVLRKLRNEIAKREGKKPFLIFQNKTLEEISRAFPQNLEELAVIKGVGEKKAKKYGKLILEIIRAGGAIENELFTNSGKILSRQLEEEQIFTVSEFINSLNVLLVGQRAVIQGEIGRVDKRNGYSFFTLRDKKEEAILNCFIWRNQLEKTGLEIKEGLEIKAVGFPEIYKRTGNLNFRAEYLNLVGEGALKQAFEALKKKLENLGFFDISRKKTVPWFVGKIGLITSQFGEAKTDFLKHLGCRGFQIYFYDARVEGIYSIDEIVSAIRWFNESFLEVDVLVLTRGGGSWESLQSFNSEAVAKAIFSSRIPVICGVGHEADETIADYVSDKRVSTPTHAAKILSQPWETAVSQISFFSDNIVSVFQKLCRQSQDKIIFLRKLLIDRLENALRIKKGQLNNFSNNLSNYSQLFFRGFDRLKYSFWHNSNILQSLLGKTAKEIIILSGLLEKMSFHWLAVINSNLKKEEEKLKLVSPETRLKQGYSLVFSGFSKRVIKAVGQLKIGDKLKIKFYQGSVGSRVEEIFKK